MSFTKSPCNQPSTDRGSDRDAALDFTKGALVLLMVLYHWLNYFVSLKGSGYSYIRFITPSFIFLAGFLITNLLAARAGQNSQSLSVRLFIRGVKLLALFTILNLGVAWFVEVGFSRRSLVAGFAVFMEAIPEIYVTGEGASFLVLLPISYTLVLAALFQKTRDLPRSYYPASAVLAFIIVSGLVLSGVRLATLELIAFGLLGLIIGHAFAQPRDHLRRLWIWLLLAYVGHLAALTVWGVPYTLQLVSVCLNLSLLYCLGLLVRPASATGRLMLLLGQYTLVGYVGQIAILQVLVKAFRQLNLGSMEAPVALVVGLLLTITMIVVIDLLRRRSRLVDSVYRLVFA